MANYKYEYIADTIRDKILNGSCKSGTKLPSIQTLAKEHSLNTDRSSVHTSCWSPNI